MVSVTLLAEKTGVHVGTQPDREGKGVFLLETVLVEKPGCKSSEKNKLTCQY